MYNVYTFILSGVDTGNCTEHGYTVADGTKKISVPYIGNIVIQLYDKAGVVSIESAGNDTTTV